MMRRVSGLDDLARILFPDNRNHRRVFVAIWLELKYADHQFLASLGSICPKYRVSPRILEIVRAKMKRLGILQPISHFNPRYGYQAGWTFSDRFPAALVKLAEFAKTARIPAVGPIDQQRDRDSIHYI